MCAGAILHARIERLVFGAADPKGGAAVSLYRLFEDRRLNHAVAVTEGILREACAEILSGFFREKRLIRRPSSKEIPILRRDTEVVVTGSTRNRFGGQKPSRGFESPSLRQMKTGRSVPEPDAPSALSGAAFPGGCADAVRKDGMSAGALLHAFPE